MLSIKRQKSPSSHQNGGCVQCRFMIGPGGVLFVEFTHSMRPEDGAVHLTRAEYVGMVMSRIRAGRRPAFFHWHADKDAWWLSNPCDPIAPPGGRPVVLRFTELEMRNFLQWARERDPARSADLPEEVRAA
jgi:hypothetical protein